ncbi:MAG TPA: LytR C-terminal domain-containing protein, partial [Solirubrobacterales bacterium]|nr:LytR C-terminal domain-containing protein [Solirubrobacterales bacterium]
LNGTGGTESGLANTYATALEDDGYQIGVVTDATDTFTESVVMFASGHQAEARKVGKAVGIDNTAPMDAAISGLSSGADVTVVIGTDHGPLPGE